MATYMAYLQEPASWAPWLLSQMWYKNQAEKSCCSLNCGIFDGVQEMEKNMSHQGGWSEILYEHFSSSTFYLEVS